MKLKNWHERQYREGNLRTDFKKFGTQKIDIDIENKIEELKTVNK